jgi:hypothetical protein
MKDLKLLVWLSQLGLSVVVPPVCLIWLAIWLRDSWGWGGWVLWVGIALGIYCAIHGLISSLNILKRMTSDKKKNEPNVSFNEHN